MKKGIVVRSGTAEVHKLDNEGEFNLGLAGSSKQVNLDGVVSIAKDGAAVTDVAATLTQVDTDLGTEATLDSNTIADIQQKLDAAEVLMGTTGAGTYVALSGDGAAAEFSAADKAIDALAKTEQDRIDVMDANTGAHSIKRQIAEVVFGAGATGANFTNPAGALDTIEGIQDSLRNAGDSLDDAPATTVVTAIENHISSSKATFIANLEGATATLGYLSGALESEISRYNTENGLLVGELSTTFTNLGLAADGTNTPDAYATENYITAAGTMVQADKDLDEAIYQRDLSLTALEGNGTTGGAMTLAGKLTVSSTADLGTVRFTANSGRFSLPNMSSTAAVNAGLDPATNAARQAHNGKFVFITDGDGATSFKQDDKLYMCEDGEWHPSMFRFEPES